MKREDIRKELGEAATDAVVDRILALNGADIEREKAKRTEIEAKLTEATDALAKMTAEMKTLQEAGASADEWKSKFEQLSADVEKQKQEAETARAEAERAERISARFNAAVGDRKFSHDAIRADYLAKFGAAISAEENAGKSDADIFHSLTKDDAAAFAGVQTVKLAGGREGDTAGESADAHARAVMGLPAK